MIKPFNLNLSFDGNHLTVDYCDGAELESTVIQSQEELERIVLETVRTSLSQEEDEEG